jgi:hypothetical protein
VSGVEERADNEQNQRGDDNADTEAVTGH